jgi:hypothetical protein
VVSRKNIGPASGGMTLFGGVELCRSLVRGAGTAGSPFTIKTEPGQLGATKQLSSLTMTTCIDVNFLEGGEELRNRSDYWFPAEPELLMLVSPSIS